MEVSVTGGSECVSVGGSLGGSDGGSLGGSATIDGGGLTTPGGSELTGGPLGGSVGGPDGPSTESRLKDVPPALVTVMVNETLASCPSESLVVQVTVVVPTCTFAGDGG